MKRELKVKRVLILALVAVMVLALVACTQTQEPAAESSAAASVTETTQAQETASQSENTTQSLKIGYIITFASHEWYQNQLKGAQQAAQDFGDNLISADAKNDQATEISVGENLLAQDIDVLIMAPVDEQGCLPLVEEAMNQGVVVVTTSVIAPKQDAYVGCTFHDGAVEEGKYAAQYVLDNNLPTPKALLVGFPALTSCVERTEGFKEGILSLIPDAEFVEIDGGAVKDTAMAKSQDALTANPDVNMIFGINDDSALGGYQAFKAAGMDESQLTVWGFGCEGVAAKNELTNPNSAYKGSLGMFPEYYGYLTVEAAHNLIDGKQTGNWLKPPMVMITSDNIDQFYTKNGDNWDMNWPVIRDLGYEYDNLPEAS